MHTVYTQNRLESQTNQSSVHSGVLTDFFICGTVATLVFQPGECAGQVHVFPWRESFDSSAPPALPPLWQSSRVRSPGEDDMTLSQSAPRTPPCCVSAANATVAQWLATPVFDFSGAVPASLSFWVRRSSTFGAPIVIDVSSDGGSGWSLLAGDTIRSEAQTSYTEVSRALPGGLAGERNVRFRLRVVPSGTGSAGTLRLDDFALTVRPPYDLALTRVFVSPSHPQAGEPAEITALVANPGLLPASGFSVDICPNCGDTVIPVPCGRLASASPGAALLPGDTLAVTLRLDAPAEGLNPLVAVVRDSSDGDASDDMLPCELDVSPSAGSIAINEIMYSPVAGEAEYVELLACGSGAVNLKGWRLAVKGSAGTKDRTVVIPAGGSSLGAGECAVVAEDSSIYRFFPSLQQQGAGRVIVPSSWETRLNNDGATLLIVDPWGSVSDSVAYSPSWHNPSVSDRTGRSLERILAPGRSNDPANWSTCALPEGGTPGRRNSVALTRSGAGGAVSASPNPFSPDGDGHDDASVLRYKLPAGVWSVSVRIFDARGRLVRTLATCAPATGDGECIWDGRDDAHLTARMGIYVIYVEAVSSSGSGMYTARGVVVLARRLR